MIEFRETILCIVVAVILYLYDSAALLHFNEGIFQQGGRGSWKLWLGSDAARFRGRYAFVPNPLTPHVPLYRFMWSLDTALPGDSPFQGLKRTEFITLSLLTLAIGAIVFLVFPVVLIAQIAIEYFAVVLVLLYALILMTLLHTWFNRRRFSLSSKQFAAISFEALVCPPCALNILRKATQNIPIAEDLFFASKRLLSSTDWEVVRRKLDNLIDEQLAGADDSSERWTVLHRRKKLLAEDDVPCR